MCRRQVENKHTTTLMRKYKHKLLQQRNENLLQQRNETQTLATSHTSHNDSTSSRTLLQHRNEVCCDDMTVVGAVFATTSTDGSPVYRLFKHGLQTHGTIDYIRMKIST